MKAKLGRAGRTPARRARKSKELARKDQFSPDDLAAAKEIARTKDLMAKVVEQMLTGREHFPGHGHRQRVAGSQLTSIFEDVKQDDLDAIAKNASSSRADIPVQKEDGLLAAIEATKKIPEDMEMYLPKTSNTANWLLENFDKTEIPKMDNLPLPDELTDIIGALQKEQEDLADKVQGAASNQLIKAMQQGGPVLDGPQTATARRARAATRSRWTSSSRAARPAGVRARATARWSGKVADDLEGRQVQRRGARTTRSNPATWRTAAAKRPTPRRPAAARRAGSASVRAWTGEAPVRSVQRAAPIGGQQRAGSRAGASSRRRLPRKRRRRRLLYLRSDKLIRRGGVDGRIRYGAARGAGGGFPGVAQEDHGAVERREGGAFIRQGAQAWRPGKRSARTTNKCSAAARAKRLRRTRIGSRITIARWRTANEHARHGFVVSGAGGAGGELAAARDGGGG